MNSNSFIRVQKKYFFEFKFKFEFGKMIEFKFEFAALVRLVVTGGRSTRRPKRSLRCLLVEIY